jgi:kynurenine formamidase
VDLSQTLRTGMAVYPGDPPVVVRDAATLERDGYAVSELRLSDQAGTHVETQAHFLAGRTLAEEPLARFIGRATVVDVPCGRVDVAHLAPHAARVKAATFLVLRSGYVDRVAAIEPEATDRPVLTPDAVAWIAAQGVGLLGIDCFDFDAGPEYTGHRALLAEGVVLVEGLVNLHVLPADGAWLFVIPLKVEGTGGAPCRAFALVE